MDVMTRTAKVTLKKIYQKLYAHFGPQHWWPGDTPFEVIVGAILTQNTNWANVEKAIANLKRARALTPQGLKKISTQKLATLIKPSGYYNIKAKRLKNFIAFLFEEYDGSLKKMKKEPVAVLRRKVLSVNGVGPETADSILLYAFGKPAFVVDAYTKRLLCRHEVIDEDLDYHAIQDLFHRYLEADEQFFNEYHALIVRVGKEFCKPDPKCFACPLSKKGIRLFC